jgi:hypothetical protein
LKLADNKVGLGEDLATLRQTIDMFHNKGSLLGDLLMGAYRNKSIRPFLTKSIRDIKRKGIPRTITDQYLEHIYGWMPLMSDVYELKKLIADKAVASLLINARGNSRTQNGLGSPYLAFNDISGRYRTNLVGCDGTTVVKTTIWAQLDPNHPYLRSMNQLGLLNPLSLAWELTPWSFVVDWFLPIGSTLGALSASAGLTFVAGDTSARTSESHSIEVEYYGDETLVNYKSTPMKSTITYEGYIRESLGTWPLPGVWAVSDPFGGKRKKRIITSLALLIQNLGFARSSLR